MTKSSHLAMGSLVAAAGVFAVLALHAVGCSDFTGSPDAPQSLQAASFQIHQAQETAPEWTSRYGQEFWRRAPVQADRQPAPRANARTPMGGLDLGEVVDRVSHAIQKPSEAALPRTRAISYIATFDGHGFVFSPHRPAPEEAAAPLLARGAAPAPVGLDLPDPATLPQPDPETAFRFQTVSVSQGERALYRADDATLRWEIVGNTAQALLEAETGLIEHYESRGEGVAVSWILARASEGSDLVVEAALSGLTFSATSDAGFHFADGTGTARVRLGRAELVDAAGTRWPVATSLAGERARWRVEAAVLAQAVFPVALDPLVSAEFGVDEPIAGSPVNRYYPDLASNGSDYLVAWQDNRSGRTWDIYAARVQADGTVLDPAGILICAAVNDQSSPAVASDGSDYLVVWEDLRNSSDWDIYASRVAGADGAVLDPGGIPITVFAHHQVHPRVTFGAADYFVVWQDPRVGSSNDIYGSRVAIDGTVRDPAGIAISTGPNEERDPVPAFNGTEYLVAWHDHRNGTDFDIFASRVALNGTVLDPAGIAVSVTPGGDGVVSVASNGADFLVVWHDTRNGANNDIYGSRVATDGSVLDVNGFPISASAAFEEQYASVAALGADYLVAWHENRNGSIWDIYASRVAADGTVLDPAGIPIAIGGQDESMPYVTSNGSAYLIGWHDNRNPAYNIFGSRVAADGTVLDGPGFPINTSLSNSYHPASASDGSGYLVVWHDLRSTTDWDIYGTRLDADGATLDVGGLAIAAPAPGSHQVYPEAAFNGTDYLVVWTDLRNGTWDIYGSRVGTDGTVLDGADTGIPISTAANGQGQPAVTSAGSDFLVVWIDDRNGANNDLYGSRVADDGTVLDPAGIPISLAPLNQTYPDVASNGSDYLVTWVDGRGASWDIYANRITGAGNVLDGNGFAVSTANNTQDFPMVASNGSDYLIVWHDARSNMLLDIYGSRVTAGGAVLDFPFGIPISVAARHQIRPDVSSDGTDYFAVWLDTRNDGNVDVYGGRVAAADGAVLDPAGLAISNDAKYNEEPRLAYNASTGDYLVTYSSEDRIMGRLVSTCGDGRVGAGEACDDGNLTEVDGCDAVCLFESGFTCAGSAPTVCADDDECSLGTDNCSGYASCANIPGSFACSCNPGFSGDGVTCADDDECGLGSDDCSDDATCTNTIGSFSCACNAGYSGDGVACTDDDECSLDTDNCSANATCTNSPGGFSCACNPGFSGNGVTCTDVDECALEADNCSDNATCTNTAGGFSCACLAGYSGSGVVCTDDDECALNTDNCAADATCTNIPGGFSCTCNPGYSGDGVVCTDLDECSLGTDNCATDATCTNTAGGFSCACLAGYSGSGVVCTDDDECALGTDNCSDDATCANTPGGFSCACNAGFAGDGVTCVDVDECALETDNCSDQATCTNSPGSFSCACNSGYSGSGVVCTDIDECALGTDNCAAEATCANIPGGFSCTCNAGYSGDGVTCADVDECAVGTDNCSDNGTCANTAGGFSCTCNSGYSGSGLVCTDDDECALNTDNCAADATCTNIPGGFSCACNPGYSGDGVVCTDVDECSLGTDNCSDNATCANTAGGYGCTCLAGFTGDGATCTDDDECALNTDDCSGDATCNNIPGGFACACNPGYSGDGVTCVDVDECALETDNCSDNATCTNTAGAFSCACNSGFSGDGVTCTVNNACNLGNDNCSDDATCAATPDGGFTCTCNAGFSGDGVSCTDDDECALGSDNCSDNATCTNTAGSFSCACHAGFTGDGITCADDDECALGTDTCSDDATCVNAPGTFGCTCNAGFTGDGVTCTDVDECSLGIDNCSDDANCTNTAGGFACACKAGFTGDGATCADDDECALQTDDCADDATCTNLPGSFACACKAGFSGDGLTCTDDDECALGTDNCSDDATCTNSAGGFGCACKAGFTGDGVTCVDDDECTLQTDDCSDDATCTNLPGSFACACNAGFSGDGVTCTDDDECGLGTDNCADDATCANMPGSFSCECSAGFEGDGLACADVDECALELDDCAAEDVCTNLPGSYSCDPPTDSDGDGVIDSLDNCPDVENPDQADEDNDGQGDACEAVVSGSGCGGCSVGVRSGASGAETAFLAALVLGLWLSRRRRSRL